MKQAFSFLFWLFIIVIFQSLVIALVRVAGVAPDLALVLTAGIALRRGSTEGLLFGWLSGLLLDVLTPQSLGVGMMLRGLLGFGLGNFKDNMFLESILAKGIIIAIAALVQGFIYQVWTTGFQPGTLWWLFWRYGFFTALYTGLVGMVWFAWWEGKMRAHLFKRIRVSSVT